MRVNNIYITHNKNENFIKEVSVSFFATFLVNTIIYNKSTMVFYNIENKYFSFFEIK